jgi:hypothetical protein
MVKKGEHDGQTWSASVKVSVQPKPVASRADLTAGWTMTAQNTDSPRYHLVESKIENAARAETCVLRRSTIEDRGAVRRAPLAVLFLDSLDLICVHPKSRNLVIELNVSARDRKGGALPGRVDVLAREFFASLRFEKPDH